MNSRLVVRSSACALLLGGILLGALTYGQPRPPQSAPGMTAGKSKRFKNIKVLKDLPEAQLIPVMHQINLSLNVKCDFCHVINPDHSGFEKDDKPPKNIARKMILMTKDINAHQAVLGKQATCYMCHHGHPEPETKAPEQGPPPPR